MKMLRSIPAPIPYKAPHNFQCPTLPKLLKNLFDLTVYKVRTISIVYIYNYKVTILLCAANIGIVTIDNKK